MTPRTSQRRLKKRLVVESCEVCGSKDTLNKHHITPRTDIDCTNEHMNLAVLCANCHGLVHEDRIKIIGLYPSTKLPNGRTLIYVKDGVQNVPEINEAYFKSKAPQTRIT